MTDIPCDKSIDRSADQAVVLLFSESASRFVVEVPAKRRGALEAVLQAAEVPLRQIGEVVSEARLQIVADNGDLTIDLPLDQLKEAWQKPLRW